MVMIVCQYVYKLVWFGIEKIGINVVYMEVFKMLIFNDIVKSYILCMIINVNVRIGQVDVVFYIGDGVKRIDYVICKVYFGEFEDWQNEFDCVVYLIKICIDLFKVVEQCGEVFKIGCGFVYKFFGVFVDYNCRYQGMEEVILDSKICEVIVKICFQIMLEDGNYVFSLYYIDSFCYIFGFIINGIDVVDLCEQVFIFYGWGLMRFIEVFQVNKEYCSYICMQFIKGFKMYVGDVYVFDGDKVIGIMGDIKF